MKTIVEPASATACPIRGWKSGPFFILAAASLALLLLPTPAPPHGTILALCALGAVILLAWRFIPLQSLAGALIQIVLIQSLLWFALKKLAWLDRDVPLIQWTGLQAIALLSSRLGARRVFRPIRTASGFGIRVLILSTLLSFLSMSAWSKPILPSAGLLLIMSAVSQIALLPWMLNKHPLAVPDGSGIQLVIALLLPFLAWLPRLLSSSDCCR